MGDWEVDVHETFAGQQLLDVAEIVQASDQTTKLAGTGMGTHVLQLRDVGLVSKTPTDAERAYVRSLFRLWGSKIVIRRDDVTVYDGWIAKRQWNRHAGTLTLSTLEMRASVFRTRLTYPVKRHLEGDLEVTGRGVSGAARAIIKKATDWGGGFVLPIDLSADTAGPFSARWAWYEHLTIEDLLQQVEKTGAEIYFRPYDTADGRSRYETVAAKEVVGRTYALPLSAAKSAATDVDDIEDGADMVTGVEYQGSGSEQDALYAGRNWFDLFPDGQPPHPNRDVLRFATDVTNLDVLGDIARADMERDWAPIASRPFNLQMDDTVSAAWGQLGAVLEQKQYADEWNDDTPKLSRVVSCRTAVGSDTLSLELQGYGR